MKIKYLFALLFLFFSLSSKAQNIDWAYFRSEVYELKYPSNWSFNHSDQMVMDFLAQAPLESETDSLRENINVVMESAQNLGLERYFESTISVLKNTFKNFNIISSTDLVRDGPALKQLSYTVSIGLEKLYFSQRFFVYDNIAYILTYTSQKSKYKQFEYIENQILDSFKPIAN